VSNDSDIIYGVKKSAGSPLTDLALAEIEIEHPIAIQAGVKIAGVDAEDSDWRTENTEFNKRRVVASQRVVDYEDALKRTWCHEDHYFVTYVLTRNGEIPQHPDGRPGFWQPRINQGGLQWLKEEGYEVGIHHLFVDIDTNPHVPWNEKSLSEALDVLCRESGLLKVFAIYFTRRGIRLIISLAGPITIDVVKEIYPLVYLLVERTGLCNNSLVQDRVSSTWQQLMRTTRFVQKDGGLFVPELWQEPSYPTEKELREILSPAKHQRTQRVRTERRKEKQANAESTETAKDTTTTETNRNGKTKTKPKPLEEVSFAYDVPEVWNHHAARIGKTVREFPNQSGIHDMYLALTGALLKRGVDRKYVPGIIRRICHFAGSSNTEGNVNGAERTVRRYEERKEVTGLRTMRSKWLTITSAVVEATARDNQKYVRDVASANQAAFIPLHSPTEAELMMDKEFHFPAPGVTCVSVGAGLGKTRAARRVATAKALLSQNKEKLSANDFSVISLDKNELAVILRDEMRDEGVDPKRLFGPASLIDKSGHHVCKFHEQAKAVQSAGLSMQAVLCKGHDRMPCPHLKGCRAFLGYDGPHGSQVVIANHSLLKKAIKEVPKAATVFIDEPKAYVAHPKFSAMEIRNALDGQMCSNFSKRFRVAMKPALTLLTVWAESAGTVGDVVSISDMIKSVDIRGGDSGFAECLLAACDTVGRKVTDDLVADVIACADGAVDPKTKTPTVTDPAIGKIRGLSGFAQEFAKVAKVATTLQQALGDSSTVLEIVEQNDQRTVAMTIADQDMKDALTREQGSTFVLDASMELKLPWIRKIVGYDPKLIKMDGADAQPIKRVLLEASYYNVSHWMGTGENERKYLALESGALRALSEAINRLSQWGCKTAGIITFKLFRSLLELAAGTTELRRKEIHAYLKRCGYTQAMTETDTKQLADVMERWFGKLVFGHFGAVRGVNTMKDVDCLVTIGDPCPNIGDLAREAKFIDVRVEDLRRMSTSEELYQSQERLRSTQRKTPGWALHIGASLPAGHAWATDKITIEEMTGNQMVAAIPPEELKALMENHGIGVRELAHEVGCVPATITRYATAQRTLSAVQYARIKAAVTEIVACRWRTTQRVQ
jgi:hypothetical protein